MITEFETESCQFFCSDVSWFPLGLEKVRELYSNYWKNKKKLKKILEMSGKFVSQ